MAQVAKTISKGVIDPASFAADGCEGILTFGVGMVSVLAGTGSTTLLATLYGLPISASHGVIGGLLAVGLVAHGSDGVGWEPLERTLVAWVASPLLGGLTAAAVNYLVHVTVHRADAPAQRAQAMQPLFASATVAVAIAFILITGPSVIKVCASFAGCAPAITGVLLLVPSRWQVRPVSLAAFVSCAGGLVVGLGSIAFGPTRRIDQLLRLG